jgi:DNA mismatch repair protein MutL
MQNQRFPIEVLPLPVVEKIAAGEVIERPASVLKELVENSIDAGATKIEAFIEGAGFSRIKIADNGCGMTETDLAHCLLRHATSKIRTSDDLFAITTMGFRGEALASVAAISRLTVATSTDQNGLGHEIMCNGGVQGKVEPVAHSQGTTTDVRDLFYNVPARKKFMKSPRSEQMAATRIVEQLAAAFPAIHFSLMADSNRLLDFPPVETVPDRIGQIAGTSFVKELIECRSVRQGLEMVAYISSPEIVHSRPRFQNLYVNLRCIDCDAVTHAIREAAGRFLSAQYRPSFFCFLTIDPSHIDVNVHPTKQLVKFDDERALFSFIYAAVQKSIGSSLAAPRDMMIRRREVPTAIIDPVTPFSDADRAASSGEGVPAEAMQESLDLPGSTRFSFFASDSEQFAGKSVVRNGDGADSERATPALPDAQFPDATETVIPFPVAGTAGESSPGAGGGSAESSQSFAERETEWDLISCYQIHETYILAPIKNGILLIDQHAAHERILYEQAIEDVSRGRSASQQLLFPVIIEFATEEKAVVLSGLRYFSSFGFEISDFGGAAVAVSAIPFFMRTADVEDTVRSMVRYLLDEQDRDILQETTKRFASAFACGAAIKAGQKLSQEEMNALVNSLFAAKNPYTCPHGRPTLVRISLDELGRRFLRM